MSYISKQDNRITKAEAGYGPTSVDAGMSALNPIGRIAAWSAVHRWWVVAGSFLVLVVMMFVLNTVETQTLDYQGEGESAEGAALIIDGFGSSWEPTERLLFSNPSLDAQSPEYRSTVEGLVSELRALPEVASVSSFYDTDSPEMVSDDGHVVLAQVVLAGDFDDAEDNIGTVLEPVLAANADEPDFEISMVGPASLLYEDERISEEDFSNMIVITMILALSFMLIAFRGVVAAIIPLILAMGSIFAALGVAVLVSYAFPMIDILAQVVLLMGMAVGVDYSLFIVSRYRNERKAGKSKMEAITTASNTTGRAVFYAGLTVLLSLVGLIFTSSDIFISMAVGVIIVVLIALVASLTLLPAMLAVLGDKVDALRLPIIGRDGDSGGGIWGAITDKVLARPAVLAIITASALIALAIPALSLNLGFAQGSDALHDDVAGKRAMELLEENFAAGLATPAFLIVEDADVTSGPVQASVTNLIAALEQDEAFARPFNVVENAQGNLLYVEIPLTASVDEDEAEASIRHLRSDIIPDAFSGSLATTYVSGAAAGSLDFTDQMTNSAPYVLAFVLGLAFILLLVMFRSIVIPFKAIVLNLLSVGAAYGVVVMVFQWGWGIGILGSEATGVIGAWLPLFLFAIVFGLSMDYHMLLPTRIKESYDEGFSNEESVSRGIKLTAGQITSAAAIMVGVFGTFALGRGIDTQQMGLGLGVAVLIDATVIRTVLLPASMKLLGDRNWYLPTWLEWLLKMSSSESGQDRKVASEAVPATSGD